MLTYDQVEYSIIIVLVNIYMALQSENATKSNAMLNMPYLWEKPGMEAPPIPLEVWKEKFRIAMIATFTINIKTLLNNREPEYPDVKLSLPPIGREETTDEKKKREANNDKLVDKADKQHEEVF